MWKPALLAALILPACAATPASERADSSADDPYVLAAATGKPVSCISGANRIRSTRGLSDHHMLFEMANGDLYRAEFANRCPGARRDEAFSHRSFTSSLCSGELLEFFDPVSGAPFGSCALGEFTPIEKPPEN